MAHNPDNLIAIDRMEMADEIASKIMDIKHIGEPWMENEIPNDERSTLIVKPELQDEFNDLYDEAEDLVRSCEVRNPFNVNWDELRKQKAKLVYVRANYPKGLQTRKDLTGIIHLIDALQEQFEPQPEE